MRSIPKISENFVLMDLIVFSNGWPTIHILRYLFTVPNLEILSFNQIIVKGWITKIEDIRYL